MPKTVKKTLAGREYVIAEKVSGIAEKWRTHLRESTVYTTFLSLDDVVAVAVEAYENGLDNLDVNTVVMVIRTLPATVSAMANSMDEINTLVYDFVPEMAADRDWLRENVYDAEIVDVFIEILKLNFPILGALELIRGLRAPGTSTNLPSVNGDSRGTKKSTARSKSR